MAGFLDKNTRVIDMVLTDYGKELYSKGELQFSFYAFSDDEVDYNPWISNSGSLTSVALTASIQEQVEATLVREAVFGKPRNMCPVAKDQTNIKELLFTIPQGQKTLPRITISPDSLSGSIHSIQQKIQRSVVHRDSEGSTINKAENIDLGFKTSNASKYVIDFDLKEFLNKESNEGFLIRLFSSGSGGLVELTHKRDLDDVLSYSNDVRLFLDEDVDSSSTPDSNQMLKASMFKIGKD